MHGPGDWPAVDSIFHKSWGGLVSAQTFFRNHRPYTILAAQTPEPFVLEAIISLQGEEPIRVERLQGIDYHESTLVGIGFPYPSTAPGWRAGIESGV